MCDKACYFLTQPSRCVLQFQKSFCINSASTGLGGGAGVLIVIILGLYRGHIGVILGLSGGYMGIMERKWKLL